MGMIKIPMSLQEPDFMIHGVLKYHAFGQELWITTTTIGAWILTATLLLIGFIASRKLKNVSESDTPSTFQCALEYAMEMLREFWGAMPNALSITSELYFYSFCSATLAAFSA